VAALFVILALALTGAWWWIHRSIPPLDGRIPLAGLQGPVDVRFDAFGIPHVFARSDEDAWRAVGFLQARDRLWQMELYRRAASGRLSEVLGAATVVIDQRFLTLGFRQAAEEEWARTPANIRTAFERYASGVNAAMAVPRGRLPLEHQLLGLAPEPWTPVDSLAISKLFSWRLGENHRAELLRYSLAGQLGARAASLFPQVPDWAPVILKSPASADAPARVAELRNLAGLEWLAPDAPAMSNAWVVHGSRTSSGRPILANDPHLQIEMPAVWWEAHVVSDTLNVTGVTIPGIPFVIIGHNERLGWGLTNVGTDVQDFFIEHLDASRQRYRVGDEWVPLQVRRHEIRVSGRDERVVFEVRATRHGPVLNPDQWREVYAGDPAGPESLQETVLALKWDVVREGNSASAFDALARATNWQTFVDAVRQFTAPAQNFVYADIDGNIGYAMSGLVPVRHASDGSVPLDGAAPDADWHGWINQARLPAVLNPPGGQIVTANNEVDRTLPFVVTRDWVAPFRAQRITELLGDRRGFDVRAMQEIQADVTAGRPTGCSSRSSCLTRSRSCKPGIAAWTIGPSRCCSRRSRRRSGGALLPTRCPSRSLASSIDMRRTSDLQACTRSSRTSARRGSTIGPRRTLSKHAATSCCAQPTMPFRVSAGGWVSRRTGDGTRFMPSSSHTRWAVAAVCSTGSSAGARCRSPATA
jgi:penicillin amidase